MRWTAAIVLTPLLFAVSTLAQTAGNVFFGYSYYNTNISNIGRASLNGWEGSFEGKIFPAVGIVADFTGEYGSQHFVNPANTCAIGIVCPTTFSPHIYEALFGPRFSASFGKFRPFAEFEFGVGHIGANGFASDTSFATALGGGLDYRIFRPVAWRFQADYVLTEFFSTHQNNVRLATGIALRF
jgi:hypothetical protein